jgi:hypothetical protein
MNLFDETKTLFPPKILNEIALGKSGTMGKITIVPHHNHLEGAPLH